MTIRENLTQRAKLLQKCEDSKQRALVMELCKRDICFFFDNFLMTDKNASFFDEVSSYEIPFELFPFQREFVIDVWDAIMEGQKPISKRTKPTNIFVEKSRQMGLSWLIVGIYLYGFIFHNHKYLMISAKQDLVDKKGDMRSLFEKIRFMVKRLPTWMLPEGLSKESETENNKFMLIGRSDGTGSITGEAANPDAGTGGTYASVLEDEMSKMPNASQIDTACSRATPCRICNSTPKGEGNAYFRVKKRVEKEYKALGAGEIQEKDLAFRWHRLHWSEHPYYTNDWYNLQKAGMTPEDVAQELDINYSGSVTGRVYKNFSTDTYEVSYNPDLPIYIALDNSHGGADPHAAIVCQIDGHYWNIIDYLELNCSVTDIAQLFGKEPKLKMNDKTLAFYKKYLDYKPPTFISDPYDTHATLNQSTIFDEYMKCGIFLNTPTDRDKKSQIIKTSSNLYRYRINEESIDLISAIANSRYPEVKENSNRTTPSELPVHDQFSHGRTAIEYLTSYLLENEIKIGHHKKVFAEPVADYIRGGDAIFRQ